MITKQRPSYLGLLEECASKYGEYLEMGVPLDEFLLPRLHKEREKVYDLEQRIEFLERKLHL